MCCPQPPPTPTQYMTAEDPNHPYTCSESDEHDASEQVISESEDCASESDDGEEVIRMKWIADGSKTLDDVIERLHDQIRFIQHLKEEGWELVREMDDDWGFIKKKDQ